MERMKSKSREYSERGHGENREPCRHAQPMKDPQIRVQPRIEVSVEPERELHRGGRRGQIDPDDMSWPAQAREPGEHQAHHPPNQAAPLAPHYNAAPTP